VGTSTSQGSPRNVNWGAVNAAYRSTAIPIDRVVQELWRAARSDTAANWQHLLGEASVRLCLRAALESETPEQAVRKASHEIARERVSSLPAEIAKRATVKAFTGGDRATAFAQALFSEVTRYLVSRDLAGLVGISARTRTTSETIAFKDKVLHQVTMTVREVGARGVTLRNWESFLKNVVDRLAR
jgi:hypothetical protein